MYAADVDDGHTCMVHAIYVITWSPSSLTASGRTEKVHWRPFLGQLGHDGWNWRGRRECAETRTQDEKTEGR
jgi:hypothetical protein